MKHFIGIDNSSLDHKVQIIDEDGNMKLHFTIPNNLSGFQELEEKVTGFNNPVIGFELPHGPLVDFLRIKGYQVYSINPLKIKRFKETTTVSMNKSDKIDANAIAHYLRENSNRIRSLVFNSPEIEKLKMLSVVHERMAEEHARYINKLHFAVRQYFCLHEELFSEFGCTNQLKLLIKYPTFHALRQCGEDELNEFLKTNKYSRKKHIQIIIDKIKSYNQLVSPEVEYAYVIEVQLLCETLLTLNQHIKEISAKMNSIVDHHPAGKYFRSLPGAGNILGCKLMALFGDNKNRFNNANEPQCLFGTAPRNYQSGNYHKVVMRRACNKSARSILYYYSFESLKLAPWARAYYDEQRKRGKSHSVALRALSNKWISIIYKIWKDDIFYEENKKYSSAA